MNFPLDIHAESCSTPFTAASQALTVCEKNKSQ